MPFLSQLNIVKSIRPNHQPIAQLRRNKLISKLHNQLLNIQSKIKGENYFVTKTQKVKKDNGDIVEILRQRKIREWWYENDDGKLIFEIKYGIKKLEFEKGKNGIEANSLNELEKVVEVLKKAVAEGELDENLALIADSIGRSINSQYKINHN